MLDLDIVDAHHHLWDMSMSYPWLQEAAGRLKVHGEDSAIRKNYLVDDFLHDAERFRLAASVHVDAGAADPVAEAVWLQHVADESGHPQAIVAAARLDAENIGEVLERLTALPNVRGVRHILNWHPDPSLTYTDRNDLIRDPAWLAGYARLAGHGMSFDLQVYPAQLIEAARLAGDHPGVPVVLNHAGMPLGRDKQALDEWRSGLRALAAQPNTAVKISGLGMTDHQWTVESLRPLVLDAIEVFGPGRAMFASNFPVDSLYSTYTALYDAFDVITADFSPAERRALFADTARRVYRLDLRVSATTSQEN